MAARRIVLLGKTGDGKSSSGNTILGEHQFSSRTSARSETHRVETREKIISGKNTTVVDTPGLFYTESPDFLKSAVETSITACSPGPNVFIIVLRVGTHGTQENEVVKQIWSLLGREAFRYSLVLFTHGNDLDEGQTIEQFVEQSKELEELVDTCGGRCHVIDNRYWNQEHDYRSNRVQVEKLLNTIDELMKENGGSNERRIVLLGKTGDGKSSSGNTILEEKIFPVSSGPKPITQQFDARGKNINGKKIKVIDTPGFFDSDVAEETLSPDVVKCISECSPGPHAFVIVLRASRYTSHEKMIIKRFTETFGYDFFKHTVVLFTCGDNLDDSQRIEEFVEESEELKELVLKCRGRCHVIDNRYWNQEHEYRSNRVQVEKLLDTIEEMVTQNGGGCYTNELWQRIEEHTQAEVKRLRRNQKGNLNDAIRQQATKSFLDRLLTEFAGISTGLVIGGLFGSICEKGLGVGAMYTMVVGVSVIIGGIFGHEGAQDAETASEAVRNTVQITCATAKSVLSGIAKMKLETPMEK